MYVDHDRNFFFLHDGIQLHLGDFILYHRREFFYLGNFFVFHDRRRVSDRNVQL